MTAPGLMFGDPVGRDKWYSRCGRYEIRRAKSADGRMVLCVMFYGSLALRVFQEYAGVEAPRDLVKWCEKHRMRALDRVATFEQWAVLHYALDLSRGYPGPLEKMARVRKAIQECGDGALRLHWPDGERSILERFDEVYRSITPPARRRG